MEVALDDVASNGAGTFVLVFSGQWRLLDDSDSLPVDVLALLDRFDDLEDDVVTGCFGVPFRAFGMFASGAV